MSEIKTWQERCLERGIGSCEARDEELIELRAALAERDASLENTRVQLAGCGVAAMQNTEASKADRVTPGGYGWSESYRGVCRAVDREIELRAKLAALEKQEPVAWMNNKRDMTYFGHYNKDDLPLYLHPPAPRQPLTDAEIEKLRDKTFSINNPFCPVDSKSMRKAVRAAEAAHGIKS